VEGVISHKIFVVPKRNQQIEEIAYNLVGDVGVYGKNLVQNTSTMVLGS
jgi:hypothetical protein